MHHEDNHLGYQRLLTRCDIRIYKNFIPLLKLYLGSSWFVCEMGGCVDMTGELFINSLCQTLSDSFEISKAITFISLLSSSLLLCVMTICTSAVDIEERNAYCLSFRKLFLLRWWTYLMLIIDLSCLLVILRKLVWRYCDRDKHSLAFLMKRA